MSLRVDLTDKNMDLVMCLVREWDCKPAEVINTLLSRFIVSDARSIGYEEKGNKEREERV